MRIMEARKQTSPQVTALAVAGAIGWFAFFLLFTEGLGVDFGGTVVLAAMVFVVELGLVASAWSARERVRVTGGSGWKETFSNGVAGAVFGWRFAAGAVLLCAGAFIGVGGISSYFSGASVTPTDSVALVPVWLVGGAGLSVLGVSLMHDVFHRAVSRTFGPEVQPFYGRAETRASLVRAVAFSATILLTNVLSGVGVYMVLFQGAPLVGGVMVVTSLLFYWFSRRQSGELIALQVRLVDQLRRRSEAAQEA